MIGFLNIDKPYGMTSHDVVAQARRKLKLRKIGHAGTLDPLATGVLVLCVDAATRLSEYIMDSTKRYEARIHLGVSTETYDAEGRIIHQQDAGHIQRGTVESALANFLGDIAQIPPMYSAIKQGGRKLYELARAGEIIEREARPVRIDSLTILDWQPPLFTLAVTCSAGTYIRSLAHDLGAALGVGAHLAGLIRTGSGAFTLAQAASLDALLSADDWHQYVISPQTALAEYPHFVVDAAAIEHLRHGRALDSAGTPPDGIAFAYDSGGVLIAVVKARDGRWQPEKVFIG